MSFDLASLGWDDRRAGEFARHALVDVVPGRVARVDRGVCTALTAAGAVRAGLGGAVAGSARDPALLPCAGDWVAVRSWPDGRVTAEVVLPRRSAVIRRTADKDSTGQVLAANLDVAAVVEPLDPSPDLGRIERLTALAWESGATPMVVLTKADRAADPDALVETVAQVAPGAQVVAVSAQTGAGLDTLLPLVAAGHTLGLLGPSGAGKSTLVNALVGAGVMDVQQVRRADGKGRHTTTYRALVPVPGGGAVLDTPGIRAVGLLDAADGVDQTFADVVALAGRCRFADCRHVTEPGCAVREALESGELPTPRFERWLRLQREVAYEMRRRDARLAAEERNRWKRLTQEARQRSRR
ncbi:ribosome small subunit-dependent GTPase A [Pilimelia columellifera]|uniref:Small ribosomal subunit biogenesis GTPase RsgA n=1 Tax=Pilimelia columellifera subsp. columellifera TaxID=706583 RepID=A0ABN3N983_9ACTN